MKLIPGLLTEVGWRAKISTALPPSSSGLGHSPLKAKTGERVTQALALVKKREE